VKFLNFLLEGFNGYWGKDLLSQEEERFSTKRSGSRDCSVPYLRKIENNNM